MIIFISKKKFIIYILMIVILLIYLLKMCFLDKSMHINKTIEEPKGYIVLIIDDFGNNGEGTDEMLNLDIPITVAIIPFLPYSKEEAKLAYDKGIDILMHTSMEPMAGKEEWLAPNSITSDLSNEEVRIRLNKGLKQLKWASGMNNHMGSKITQDERIMKEVLKVVKQNNLIYVDSKTTPKSKVKQICELNNIHYFGRDVFLDNVKSEEHIRKQILKLSDIALKKGYAIGIGHVGAEGGLVTVNAIKSVSKQIRKKGIRFVNISQLKKILINNNKN